MDSARFRSAAQERLFQSVAANLRRIGYDNNLLISNYAFKDYLASSTPERVAPLAAFGQWPPTYTSACHSVLASNGASGIDLLQDYRALGASLSFEVRDDRVLQWIVGSTNARTKLLLDFGPDEVDRIFDQHANEWSPAELLRAKNIPARQPAMQGYLFDDELIPRVLLSSGVTKVFAQIFVRTSGERLRKSRFDQMLLCTAFLAS